MTGGRIALLGWGSLLWEGGGVFDALHEPWQYEGPVLKLEFSRVSSSRSGALTLVIDPENGAPVQVAWCLSRRAALPEAIEDLRQREHTNSRHIGRFAVDGSAQCHDPKSLETIRAWAADRRLRGVVWTDLPSNFAEEVGEPFSITAAKRYLWTLVGDSGTQAVDYFLRAPSFVRTPLRDALAREIGRTTHFTKA